MHLQNNCVVDILLRCECMYEVRIRFLKIFDPIVTEISSAHIERGLAHGSALSLDLSHFRLRILGCNKNMKISRSLQIMTPVTQIQNLAILAVLVLGKFSKTAPKFWFLQVFWTKKPFQRVVKCWDLCAHILLSIASVWWDFIPPFSLHISNSRTKPAVLDF